MFRRVQSEKSGKYIGIVLLYHQEKENPSSVERPTLHGIQWSKLGPKIFDGLSDRAYFNRKALMT